MWLDDWMKQCRLFVCVGMCVYVWVGGGGGGGGGE